MEIHRAVEDILRDADLAMITKCENTDLSSHQRVSFSLTFPVIGAVTQMNYDQ